MMFFFGLDPDDCASVSVAMLSQVTAELCRSHRLGLHLVVIPRATAAWLAQNVSLSEMDRAILRRIGSEYTQSGALRFQASSFVNVNAQHVGPPAVLGNEVRVSVETLAAHALTQKSVLVVEDLVSDGYLYRKIFEARTSSFRGGVVEFEVAHGGGERIQDIAADKIHDRRVVVVIVDSDKRAPSEQESTKVRRLQQMLLENNWALAVVVVLPCHEVENILDFSVIGSLPCIVGRETELSDLILIDEAEEVAGTESNDRFRLYFDFKEGISLEAIQALDQVIAKNWILEKLRLAGTPREIRGFGPNILSSLFANGEALGVLRQYLRSRRFSDVFGDTFERVMWVGIAARRQFL